ncbi:M23 family metallopeptidase [Algoriphagus sp. D3-2-R+10]|uniref:M23 family metallopeptidase n=1 Tax=Algoriphagus aurantiacus TaxID=3103948 RepID=UPI002B371A9D|nr:M23 family metallopeptidase [Algoriphagus sp. D3-2-R+10]MEB2778376.1 M23 family metallopeptidase [Algoriphagus sp. D3-2-R+10]
MKLSKLSYTFIFLGLITSLELNAQEVDKGYFKNPINPGTRNYLSGNFAELRPNHFHTGLDFKTGGQEGLPILAAADGWVYRIKISSFGYGNVIYLKHPNGKITLYGHLRNFNKELSDYMRKKMYAAKANELEIYLEPGELPVKQGQRIADSGNTGGSGGPHLHFEIRDSLDRAMDPLLFGFPEILDNVAPVPQSIAIVPLDIDSRVNGKFARLEVTPVASGSNYRLPNDIKITGKVGVEIRSFDQLDGASNRNGYPTFELADEKGTLFNLTVDKVDFNYSRQFLQHTYQNRYSKLYYQKNLKFEFFSPKSDTTGHLALEPGVKKDYKLKLRDAYGNERQVSFTLQGQDLETNVNDGTAPSRASLDYINNILKIKASITPKGGLAKFYVGANQFEMLPAYQDANSRTYLWDMDFGIPEEIDICSEVVIPGINARIPAGKEISYSDKNLQMNFNHETLLDDFFLRVSQSGSLTTPLLNVNGSREYLWNAVNILWKVPGYTGNKDRAHAYYTSGGSKSFLGGTWVGDTLNFGSRYLGEISILEDIVKPTIKVIRVNSSDMRFVIRDDLSGIDSFEAYVNGKWVLMRYEHKQAVIWSEKLTNEPFKGEVLLKVTDKAGNTAEWKGTIG